MATRLQVVPYQPRLLLAQILDMSSWVETGEFKKGIKLKGKDERGKPILRRYKINVLEYNDNSDPTAAPWDLSPDQQLLVQVPLGDCIQYTQKDLLFML